ncbi:MAG: CapA family protein [Clostridiaceae bacterium]|nr:CapA family protein [Clostridiaceae bacterium]
MKILRFIPFIIIISILCSGCPDGKSVSSTANAIPREAEEIPLHNNPSDSKSILKETPPTPIVEKKASASILSAGDVIMHDAVIQSGKTESGIYDYTGIFEFVKPYAEKADYSIISYEGVCMDSDKNYTGYPLFNAPPAIISAFSYAGFDMVNNGNNHCLDRALDGLFETRSIIKQKNLQVIGTFQDAAEPRYKIQDINGIKVGFLSYTYGCNMNENRLTEEERSTHLSLIDRDKIETEIKTLKPKADIIIVLIHWGVEYRRNATDEQKKLAENIFSWGADIILGSHPHVVEPSETIEIDGDIKYLIYSMGNFLSNQIGGNNPNPRNNDLTEDGMMIDIQIEKDFQTGKTSIVSVKHIPTWVYRYTENGIYKYKIYPVPSLDHGSLKGLDEALVEKLKNSYSRTMELVKDYP